MTPLTHHEILRYVGPFARAGRHVDLAKTRRKERLIEFEPIVHDSDSTGELKERLQLDLSQPTARLHRTLETLHGLKSKISARDTDVELLLERLVSIPLTTHFRQADGLLIADSYRCPADSTRPLKLQESCAHVKGLVVTLDARTVVGEPMTLTLAPSKPQSLPQLPDDIFAVLGSAWTVLRDDEGRWKSLLYAPKREPTRSQKTLERFESSVKHLQKTLELTPSVYHMTYKTARWKIWLRRLLPIGISVGLLASLPFISRFVLTEGTRVHTLLLGLPNVLILTFMYISRHEIPRIEVPPRPRPLTQVAWSSENVDT